MATAFPFDMKITGALFPGRGVVQPKSPFSAVLHRQLPPPLPIKRSLMPPAIKPVLIAASAPLVATSAARSATSAALATARTASNQSAAHLQEARVAYHHVADERLEGRLIDLICKELVIEFTSEPSKSRVANQDLPLAPPVAGLVVVPVAALAVEAGHPVDGAVKAAQAVELIERIETFIKDSRHPCLALTLNNSLGAKVEIERVGPREVALKIVGHRGPPPAEDISRIREEMQARGLKVCALSVA